jgi:hypothetical protein
MGPVLGHSHVIVKRGGRVSSATRLCVSAAVTKSMDHASKYQEMLGL